MDRVKQTAAKKAVGYAAAGLVEDDMLVGLGTGSTTAFAIEALGRRVREEGLKIKGTPTSFAAEQRARHFNIPLIPLDSITKLDIALDGADEIDPDLNLIKGGGAAHTREKVVAALARQFVVLADTTKIVDHLGQTRALPIEVLPMACGPVMRMLEKIGGIPEIRMGKQKDGPIVTDQGFWIIDTQFALPFDPAEMDRVLNGVPGILDHGLFIDMASVALVASETGEIKKLERKQPTRLISS